MRRALIFFALLAVCIPALARNISVPRAQGFVNDYAGVLDSGIETKLSSLIKELKQKTTAEIAVLTVDSTAPYDIFDYALAVAEEWKPGSAEKDNGIVFVVAVKDRKLWILTGYGLEGILPDARVGGIRDSYVVPYFKAGDYATGIYNGTVALAQTIAKDAGVSLTGVPALPDRPAGSTPSSNDSNLLWILLLIFFFLPPLFGRRSRGFLPLLFLGGMAGSGRGFSGFGGGGGFGGFGGGSFGGGGAGGGW